MRANSVIHFFSGYRMGKCDPAGAESWKTGYSCAVLTVSADGNAAAGKLDADLVVPSAEELYGKQGMTVMFGFHVVGKDCFFCVLSVRGNNGGKVLFFVKTKVID